MDKKKLLCLLLALFLLTTCILTIGCDQTTPPEDANNDTGDVGNSQTEENNYTLGNIKNTIADYTIIRSEKATKLVKNAVILARTTIKEATDTEIEVGEDWVEDMKSDHEILVGETNRPESA